MNKTVVNTYIWTMDFLKKIKFELLVRPFLWKKPKYDKAHAFSICAIFKDEGKFLKEWVEYHQIVGIEHFYLYNNGSTDNYRDVLQPYVEKGIITLIDFPGEKMQFKAYADFYTNYANETQWVSFLDLDEFICPNASLNIKEWIKSYEHYPAILIYWKMFGTSGKMKHDDENLVTEQYHVCWDKMYHVGKCFFNTDYQIANTAEAWFHQPVINYPFLWWKAKVYPVNQFKKVSINELSKNIISNENNPPIQINHYWSKAWDLYDAKRNRPSVNRGELKTRMPYFLWHENKNCSTDYNIYKYMMQLKLKMNGVE